MKKPSKHACSKAGKKLRKHRNPKAGSTLAHCKTTKKKTKRRSKKK